VLIDHRRLIKAFNRSAERLFSYTAGEVLGGNVGILMSEAERAQHHQHIRRYLETGEPHIIGRGREVLAQRKDGASFPIFLSVGVLPDGPMTASDCGDKRYSRWCALTGCGGR
jgi:PAS domain S-box-containing protein